MPKLGDQTFINKFSSLPELLKTIDGSLLAEGALRHAIVNTKKDVESMGEENMHSLQALMDRLSELETMISTVMKAANASAESIQSRLKSS